MACPASVLGGVGLANGAAGALTASGAMIGAGIFVLPIVVGSLMYFLGGLAFGIGFSRLLARREAATAAAIGTLGADGSS